MRNFGWMALVFLFLLCENSIAQGNRGTSMGETIAFLQNQIRRTGKSGGDYSEITKVVVNPCVLYWKEVFHQYTEVDSIENYLPATVHIQSTVPVFDGQYIKYDLRLARYVQIYYYNGRKEEIRLSTLYLQNRDKSLPERIRSALEQLAFYCRKIK